MSKSGMGELVSEVAHLNDQLDTTSYYAILDIDQGCDYIGVRDAFYARAQRFHPDRFVILENEPVKKAVYSVYKRMTEAYQVLTDPQLRAAYDAGLAEGQFRLSSEQRSRRLDADERQVSNPFARIYLRSGRQKFERGDLNGAWIDCELGLSVEETPPLRNLHVAVVRALAGR
ncbi:DnaJ domain-containing protein [Pseudenhygromyxa sp. WMMC2535]|uniref:J domain-containing protein n=1 Tax=Pseudenhygromyxa sp. WMMC2535 TaxID=2712867 RepID=UPI00155773A3|nr:DnaJ domain-containing protein [Pseudenhygromyxa sp. WMMC2535]NVB39099.1 DnaJ domain-containing protein [Pseudenhygromyxa sp. WMMC2535]